MAALLTGCAQASVETVSDYYESADSVPSCRIQLDFPKEAAQPAMEADDNSLYFCDGFDLRLETLPAGNLSGVLQQITGFPEEKLTLMHTDRDGYDRWDFAWCSAGESGNLVGRAAVLDDGTHCYCVSVLAEEANTEALQETWQRIFSSITLV